MACFGCNYTLLASVYFSFMFAVHPLLHIRECCLCHMSVAEFICMHASLHVSKEHTCSWTAFYNETMYLHDSMHGACKCMPVLCPDRSIFVFFMRTLCVRMPTACLHVADSHACACLRLGDSKILFSMRMAHVRMQKCFSCQKHCRRQKCTRISMPACDD